MELSYKRNGLMQRAAGWATVGAALALLASPVLAQTAPKAPAAAAPAEPSLKKAQIDALLAKPAGVLVLDVRRADEISDNGGFPAFLNIQLADLDHYLAYIPKDRTIIAVSNHAHRAETAAVLLRKNGFKVAGIAGALDYADEGGVLTGKKKPAQTASVATAAPAK
jgi:rhodanese-related sulfurtransferase